ncbi:MAG: pyridoxamine 5'-phosphate oxidase [Saprospiraceae bacterium]|nr:pyridoxamine 5'-phosphate oxidase [Saprospiraceae bacterium]
MDNLKDRRTEYLSEQQLTINDIAKDPIVQFERWYLEAEKAGVSEPNGMTLSTVSEDGKPSSRIVLLKGFNQKGFSFYTNYESRKSREILANPQVSAVFWWRPQFRQIRIEGVAEKLDRDTSMSYFHSRPRGSQISATASPQSQEITLEEMRNRRAEMETKFDNDNPIPLPDFWGGFVIRPYIIEFWQGQENRYHDRFRYRHSDDGSWKIDRLAP